MSSSHNSNGKEVKEHEEVLRGVQSAVHRKVQIVASRPGRGEWSRHADPLALHLQALSMPVWMRQGNTSEVTGNKLGPLLTCRVVPVLVILQVISTALVRLPWSCESELQLLFNALPSISDAQIGYKPGHGHRQWMAMPVNIQASSI